MNLETFLGYKYTTIRILTSMIVSFAVQMDFYQLSIINYQLSIINYQLSIINYQLSIIN